jgi:DNA-directed RNA polymerase subunit RPC12/RpoP
MIFHRQCNYILKADVSKATKMLANFSVAGKFTAQITELTIHKTGIKKLPIIYFCARCNTIVEDQDDMICHCDSCGNISNIKEMKYPKDSGGIYCEKCSKRFEDETLHSLSIKDIRI